MAYHTDIFDEGQFVEELVYKSDTELQVNLDGIDHSFNLPTGDDNIDDYNYYCTDIKLKKYCSIDPSGDSVSNFMGYGNLKASQLTVKLNCKDASLLPSNTSGPYYGHFTKSGYIDVYSTFTTYNSDGNISKASERQYLGRYYIDSWESGSTNSDYTEITITASDLFSRIKDINISDIELTSYTLESGSVTKEETLGDIIKDAVNCVNSQAGTFLTFDKDAFNGAMQVFVQGQLIGTIKHNEGVKFTTFGELISSISKYCLINFYISSIEKLCFNKPADMLYKTLTVSSTGHYISGGLNSMTDGGDLGCILDSDKLSLIVKYVPYFTKINTELISQTIQLPQFGYDLSQLNIDDKIEKVTGITFNTEASDIFVQDLRNNAYKIYGLLRSIHSEDDGKDVQFTIYGWKYTAADMVSDETYKTSNSGIVNIENPYININSEAIFAKELHDMAVLNNKMVYVEGFLTLDILIGDLIFIENTELKIADVYRVIQIEYNLNTNYRCKMYLTKY